MKNIIDTIKKELAKQELSETGLAKKAGVHQNTVNRFLSGKTKRLDTQLVMKLQDALGIVADPETAYGVTTVHRQLKPEEEALLKMLDEVPEVREAIRTLAQLPERKRKIHLGKMLEDLEKLEEGKG